jgi:hypothetical protein
MKLLIYFISVFNVFSCQQDKSSKLDKNDYSISYPSHLELDESGKDDISFVLTTQKDGKEDIFIENINLVTKNTNNIHFNEFVGKMEKDIESVAKIVESKRLKLNGKNCLRLVFNLNQNGIDLTFIQHYFLENQKAYVLTFSCEPPLRKVFRTNTL